MKVRRKKTKVKRNWKESDNLSIRRQCVSTASKQEKKGLRGHGEVTRTVVVAMALISSPTMAFGPRTPLPWPLATGPRETVVWRASSWRTGWS